MPEDTKPIEYGKTDMTAAALIQRAVRRPVGWKSSQPRWQAIAEIFKLGMTSSMSICSTAGYEPFETLRQFNKTAQ